MLKLEQNMNQPLKPIWLHESTRIGDSLGNDASTTVLIQARWLSAPECTSLDFTGVIWRRHDRVLLVSCVIQEVPKTVPLSFVRNCNRSSQQQQQTRYSSNSQ